MIDPKLVRWINASLNKAFDVGKGAYPLYIEGQEITYDASKTSWAEFHLSTGPDIEERLGTIEVKLTVTIMCTSVYTLEDYDIHKVAEQFLPVLLSCIEVKKYGDDSSSIGFLEPKGPSKVQPWGPVQLTVDKQPLRVKQQSIEQDFYMSF